MIKRIVSFALYQPLFVVLGMILFDVLKLATPGVAVGLLLAAALIRLNSENMGIPLSNVETLAYVVAAAIAILVAVVGTILFWVRRRMSTPGTRSLR